MNKWKDSTLSLGERCVAFAENEMKNNVAEDKPGSYTSPRIREYFKICTRLVNGKESPIGLNFTKGNWCASSVSFCLHESLLPGEIAPHGYRLGVVEVVNDMENNETYHDVSEVRSGKFKIEVGDVVFFDRSNPNNPATAWFRHIGFCFSINSNGNFKCISGNSTGKWRITDHKLSQKTLLGFGEYSNVKVPVKQVPIDWDNVDIHSLAPSEDTGKDLHMDKIWNLFDNTFKK